MEIFNTIRAQLQELENAQKMTMHELRGFREDVERFQDAAIKRIDMLSNSLTMAHAATTALGGTFASIEGMFADHEKRLQAIEKKLQPPPAA